jgi:hypothetical protein
VGNFFCLITRPLRLTVGGDNDDEGSAVASPAKATNGKKNSINQSTHTFINQVQVVP